MIYICQRLAFSPVLSNAMEQIFALPGLNRMKSFVRFFCNKHPTAENFQLFSYLTSVSRIVRYKCICPCKIYERV